MSNNGFSRKKLETEKKELEEKLKRLNEFYLDSLAKAKDYTEQLEKQLEELKKQKTTKLDYLEIDYEKMYIDMIGYGLDHNNYYEIITIMALVRDNLLKITSENASILYIHEKDIKNTAEDTRPLQDKLKDRGGLDHIVLLDLIFATESELKWYLDERKKAKTDDLARDFKRRAEHELKNRVFDRTNDKYTYYNSCKFDLIKFHNRGIINDKAR